MVVSRGPAGHQPDSPTPVGHPGQDRPEVPDEPMPVPTSSDQRATMRMSQRTLIDRAAPTLYEEAQPTLLDPIEAAPAASPAPKEEAPGRDGVMVITAEVKAPVHPADGQTRRDDIMTTADMLEAMEDLDEVEELELDQQEEPPPAAVEEEEPPPPVVEEEEPPAKASGEEPAKDEEDEDIDFDIDVAVDDQSPAGDAAPEGPDWELGQQIPLGEDNEEPTPTPAPTERRERGGSMEVREAKTGVFERPWASRKERGLVVRPDKLEAAPAQAHGDAQIEQGFAPPMLDSPRTLEVLPVGAIHPSTELVLMTEPGAASAEQYRVLALKLKDNVNVRSIGVMGPTSDAGAEAVAANLAIALAEGSRSRVCVVDGDMRRSQLCRLFGVDPGVGLAAQLREHSDNREAGPWKVLGVGPALHLMPCRGRDSNPAELLNSEAIWELMQELRREFDYIVITTPPLLEAADGVILQEHADGVILAARAGLSRQDAIRTSLTNLGEGKLLGTVLLDVKERGSR